MVAWHRLLKVSVPYLCIFFIPIDFPLGDLCRRLETTRLFAVLFLVYSMRARSNLSCLIAIITPVAFYSETIYLLLVLIRFVVCWIHVLDLCKAGAGSMLEKSSVGFLTSD
ncbi:hypothetical protein BDY19DRAFT_423718 [Irpex rosettiformis]|uniref:Uncharacterized protein n=1 Tax=Irpex rosettiformis TaxID=378272 RepID=A0ACB8UI53_9APHY|nr:hypothetical protein BDY19DRAFT_423718 [Irpex rosettiformis]